jgi:gliding motility-associated-like protein
VQNLPFTFCFFDSLYDFLVVGANGCVSFDTSRALQWCEPKLYQNPNTPRPLPSTAYARALIGAVMQDLDPFDTAGVSPTKKVEFRIEGVDPCRRAVISYYKVPLWPGLQGNCQSSINTYQMVLHEGSGIIDVYQKDKPPCNGSNYGSAILGIQNWARDYSVSPRNRNVYAWGGLDINESTRFLPFGGNPKFIQAQLWEGNHVIASTTTPSPAGFGLLNIQFNNICPLPSTPYLICKTFYSACTGNGQVELDDTVIIHHNTQLLGVNYDIIFASCGGNNGSITVHVPPGAGVLPYQYSINGGPLQFDSTFHNLATGNYTVHVQDASGCFKDTVLTVRAQNQLFVTFVVDTPSCNLANDGKIIVTVLNGNPPFQYSINGGTYQASNTFNNLAPGTYTINVIDATGCSALNQTVQVPQGPPLAVTIQTTSTSCSGANNGTITVTPINGRPPYKYSLNGGPFQLSNVFTNLAAGNYTIHVIDVSGCDVNNVPAQVLQGQPLNATTTQTNVSCNGGNNGNITVTVNNGVAPYQYSLNGVNYQPSNIFNGLTAGNYTVHINDNNGCSGTVSVVISQPSALVDSFFVIAVRCNGEANGGISITTTGGVSPYLYSINGTVYQISNAFNGLTAGNYTTYVKDSNGCISTQIVNVPQPQPIQISAATQNASCGGGPDGKIIVTVTGGNGNNLYSIDGTNFQPSNIFNVTSGTYTVTVKDGKNCSGSLSNITVGVDNNLRVTAIKDTAICLGKSINLNAVSNATQYTWTPATGLNATNIANPIATPTTTTTYIVNAVLGPCIGSDTVVITVLPAPTANAGSSGKICSGDSIQLQGSGGVSYQWSPATGLNNATIANPFAKPTQSTNYSLVVTDANGCTSLTAANATVTVIPPFNVHITPNSYVSPGEVIQLHAEGGIKYLWTPPFGLDNPAISDPLATITRDITYRVMVTTAEGCKSQDSVNIKAFKGPDIYVPTAFTPNHDGKNDKLTPIAVGIKEFNYFKIYNRWGQLVFSTSRLREGWDGTFGGIDQDTGVYVWIVRGVTDNGRVIFKRGTAVLIR